MCSLSKLLGSIQSTVSVSWNFLVFIIQVRPGAHRLLICFLDYDFRQSLSPIAQQASAIVSCIRHGERRSIWTAQESKELFPGMMFNAAKSHMEGTRLWEIVSKIPKGALLHAQFVSPDRSSRSNEWDTNRSLMFSNQDTDCKLATASERRWTLTGFSPQHSKPLGSVYRRRSR